ncbi:hypothetical protein GOP47_0024693 [Adiantum capillus-veneris]|uniref:Uncharacterized protein n=1 Tax=Adiantum capillus-veneris TaxID=13818 RepID=A0A9D4U3D4_ADICA|nr:hypothetical protein GOP47_0024693 [Adiantum capillus-veneris]
MEMAFASKRAVTEGDIPSVDWVAEAGKLKQATIVEGGWNFTKSMTLTSLQRLPLGIKKATLTSTEKQLELRVLSLVLNNPWVAPTGRAASLVPFLSFPYSAGPRCRRASLSISSIIRQREDESKKLGASTLASPGSSSQDSLQERSTRISEP